MVDKSATIETFINLRSIILIRWYTSPSPFHIRAPFPTQIVPVPDLCTRTVDHSLAIGCCPYPAHQSTFLYHAKGPWSAATSEHYTVWSDASKGGGKNS